MEAAQVKALAKYNRELAAHLKDFDKSKSAYDQKYNKCLTMQWNSQCEKDYRERVIRGQVEYNRFLRLKAVSEVCEFSPGDFEACQI